MTSIVPCIFLLLGVIALFNKNNTIAHKYKYSFIIVMIFFIISNIKIYYLEDKFSTLYNGLNEVEIIGIVTSEGKANEYTISYTIKVESINGDKKYKNTNLIIYLKKRK